MKPFPLILSAVLLAGCKTVVGGDIYLSDLPTVLDNGTPATTQLTLKLEMPSSDTCTEQADAVLTVYQTHFLGAEFVECSDEDSDNMMVLNVQTPMLAFTDTPPLPDQAIAIGVSRSADGIAAYYLSNGEASKAIWDALPEDLTSSTSYDPDTHLTARVVNDSAAAAEITIGSVFVDDAPVIGPETRTLDRREEMSLTFSDVANATFDDLGKPVSILTMKDAH